MMSRSFHGFPGERLSDSVFSEDESGFQDLCSPGNSSHVFSHNVSVNSLYDAYSSYGLTVNESYSPKGISYQESARSVSYHESPRGLSYQESYSPRGQFVRESHSPRGQFVRESHSPRGQFVRESHSPAVSNYSTYSQEVKYIFDPNFGMQNQMSRSHSNIKMQSTPAKFEPVDPAANSTEDDYSHIQYPNRKSNVQRKGSNSSQLSQVSYRGQGHSKNPPPPPPRTSSSASASHIQGEGTLTQRKASLTHSMSASYSANYIPHTRGEGRRRTWSPEGLNIGYPSSNTRRSQRLRSYSNDQLVEATVADGKDRDHVYEELEAGPPKLTPISGMLNKSPGRGIVKPIAFKPVVTNQKLVTPPKPYLEHGRKYSSHDDGYGSQDYGVTTITSHNMSATSQGSTYSQMEFDRSASFSSDCNRTSDRADSVAASHMSRLSSNPMDGYVQTPSPSDSGVGELEAILKEKDAEINTLRDVMDKNERAIFQVYEEKRNGWIREIQEMREEYDNKMKQIQRKQYKTEQVLNLQVFKLQQDKKTMNEEIEKVNFEKDELIQKCEVFAEETNRLQAQMDDATWQGQGRNTTSGDLTNLHSQINSLKSQLKVKSDEVLQLQSKLNEAKSKLDKANANFEHQTRLVDNRQNLVPAISSESLQRMNNSGSDLEPDIPLCQCEKEIQTDFAKAKTPERETLKPSLICEKDREVSALREDLDKLRLEILVSKEEHEKEKEQWLEEKNKVIMYQKQLQLNYVQMFRKNKVLEAEVEQLTLELESRDMKLMALNGGEESVC